MTTQIAIRHQEDEGHYAGFVSRLGAFIVDVCIIILIFAVAGATIEWLVNAVSDRPFQLLPNTDTLRSSPRRVFVRLLRLSSWP